MKRTISILFFTYLALVFGLTCFANEVKNVIPPVPTNNIYLQDFAKVTNEETKRFIMRTSTNLQTTTTAEVAVVVVDTLNNMPIKEYSLELFRKWGIGNKEKNNGVLILLVTSTKQIRIEVGYGLEGILTDAKCGAIIREKMEPSIWRRDYDTSIINGYTAVVQEVGHEYKFDPLAARDIFVYKYWPPLLVILEQIMIVVGIAIVLFLIYWWNKPKETYKPTRRKKHGGRGGFAGNSDGFPGMSGNVGGGFDGGGSGGGGDTGGGFGGGSSGGGGANS